MKRHKTARALEEELEHYPVTYEFGHTANRPCIWIKCENGRGYKFTFTEHYSNNDMAVGDIRRTMRTLGVERRGEGPLAQAMKEATKDREWIEHDRPKIHLPTNPALQQPTTKEASPMPQQQPQPRILQDQRTVQAADNGKGKEKRLQLTYAEVIAISRLLDHNGVVSEGNYVYNAGWNDEKVFQVVHKQFHDRQPQLNISAVIKVRREHYGLLKTETASRSYTGKGKFAAKVFAQLGALERRFDHFEVEVLRRLDALEDATTRPR